MHRFKILFVSLLQRSLPHHFLSRIVYYASRVKAPWLKNFAIRVYMQIYGVSLHNAEKTEVEDYPTFNAFFTRQLLADARPIDTDDNTIISPVDGTVSQVGDIVNGKIFQAKGADFDLNTLLGDSKRRNQQFQGGRFATLYLAPKDYHRIHAPVAGKLTQMCHIPGRLFSVNDISTQAIPGLFARNERVVTVFETAFGPMAVILVGAIFVSSMETVWHGPITPPGGSWIREFQYTEKTTHTLEKADELGRFNMGSTVILLFGKDTIDWDEKLQPGYIIRMGQRIATRH